MFVYVFTNGLGHCKVGLSNNPANRARFLSDGSPTRLSVYCAHPVDAALVYKAESKAHELLTEYHVHREWFEVSPEIAEQAIIKAIADPTPQGIAPNRIGPRHSTSSEEFRELARNWRNASDLARDLGITRFAAHRYLDGSRSVPETIMRLTRILVRMPRVRAEFPDLFIAAP